MIHKLVHVNNERLQVQDPPPQKKKKNTRMKVGVENHLASILTLSLLVKYKTTFLDLPYKSEDLG